MTEGARVLVLSDDDDVSEPLAALLKRAGYEVDVNGAAGGIDELKDRRPDVLILDSDLPTGLYQDVLALLERRTGADSFPLIVLGGGRQTALPRGWHEDAARSTARPPAPGELLATIEAVLRLAFYRPYRDLVHDLSGPVTAIHALSRSIARLAPASEADRRAVLGLVREADRLMTLMEEFQRTRRPRSG